MANLYHISIIPKADITREQVEEQMNLAVDWFRYRPGVYIVDTTSDEDKWQSRLKPLVEPDGSLFICKFDTEHFNGFMEAQFWTWLRKKLNAQPS